MSAFSAACSIPAAGAGVVVGEEVGEEVEVVVVVGAEAVVEAVAVAVVVEEAVAEVVAEESILAAADKETRSSLAEERARRRKGEYR